MVSGYAILCDLCIVFWMKKIDHIFHMCNFFCVLVCDSLVEMCYQKFDNKNCRLDYSHLKNQITSRYKKCNIICHTKVNNHCRFEVGELRHDSQKNADSVNNNMDIKEKVIYKIYFALKPTEPTTVA